MASIPSIFRSPPPEPPIVSVPVDRGGHHPDFVPFESRVCMFYRKGPLRTSSKCHSPPVAPMSSPGKARRRVFKWNPCMEYAASTTFKPILHLPQKLGPWEPCCCPALVYYGSFSLAVFLLRLLAKTQSKIFPFSGSHPHNLELVQLRTWWDLLRAGPTRHHRELFQLFLRTTQEGRHYYLHSHQWN